MFRLEEILPREDTKNHDSKQSHWIDKDEAMEDIILKKISDRKVERKVFWKQIKKAISKSDRLLRLGDILQEFTQFVELRYQQYNGAHVLVRYCQKLETTQMFFK